MKSQELSVVTIGGGTGSSVLLRGLKKYVKNVSAIVTVADDGGGSGVLRKDIGMLPPGDIRACLIALANTEPEMEALMNYRFKDGNLKGQSFGNLLIAALSDIYGGFEEGLRQAEKVLAITGKIFPMTLEDVVLYAELEDGSIIEGESNITFLSRQSGEAIKRVFIKPEMPKAVDGTVEAIEGADIILIGPGSLYTSIMPNLLVDDISQALKKTKAKKIYITNCMTQAGETDYYTVIDHVRAIQTHVGENFLDYVVANTEEIPVEERLRYYYETGSEPVLLTDKDREDLDELGINLITGPFVEVSSEYIRHDSDTLLRYIWDYFGIEY